LWGSTLHIVFEANTKQEQQIKCGTSLDIVVKQRSTRKIFLKYFLPCSNYD